MAKVSRRLPFDRTRDLVVMKKIMVGDKVFLSGSEFKEKGLVSDRRLQQLYENRYLAHKGEETLLSSSKSTPPSKRGERINSRSVKSEPRAKIGLKKDEAGAGAA